MNDFGLDALATAPATKPAGLASHAAGLASHPDSITGRRDRPPGPGALAELALAAGLRQVQIVAWRDLEDPEAGGSEIHAARMAERWAAAGLDVSMRTSRVPDRPRVVHRGGYRVERRAGRYRVFPDVAIRDLLAKRQPARGLVEIWNGMPFFSPLWTRGPRMVFLHHVHAEMWRMVMPARLARVGELVERRVAPTFYRRTPIVTLSHSARDRIVATLGLPPDQVSVVEPGIDARYRPGSPHHRSPHPLVVAVGRLVPYKRFEELISVLAQLRRRIPDLEAVIAGEGYDRPELEAAVAAHGAASWLGMPGRLSDDDVVDLYRRAWVVASSSSHEGWGMTLTEAAACATPAVATRISGHLDAIDHGRSGLLTSSPAEMEQALAAVLTDAVLRRRLGQGALRRAQGLTWDRTAHGTLEVLAADARRRRGLQAPARP